MQNESRALGQHKALCGAGVETNCATPQQLCCALLCGCLAVAALLVWCYQREGCAISVSEAELGLYELNRGADTRI